ncbi:hypothetical protein C0995_003387 [Termitomyces sp. Mi166|nr:hypothetical protein C0995_003387 [Termitomyces sp. Mi166\
MTEDHLVVASELSTEHHPGLHSRQIDAGGPPRTDQEPAPETLLYLMTLSHLRSLSVRFSGPLPSPSAIPVFPALQLLSFLCDDHEVAVQLLKLLPNSKLVKVKISFHQQLTDWYEWDALLQVLSKVSHSSLISISLHDLAKMSSIEEFEYEPLAFVSLRPLLAFTHLQTLVIFVAQGINYNDPTIDELARALPRLEQLSFDHAATLAYRPNATLASIVSIAALCANIKLIQLTIDATKLDAIPCPAVARNNPVDLQFGYSPLKKRDASSVASMLRGIFSHISCLHGFYVPTYDVDPSFDPDDDSPWFKVGQLTMHENLKLRNRRY